MADITTRSSPPRAGYGSQAASEAIELIGDAWSWMVLREAIFGGVTRFDQFRGRLGIARSTLTARLNQLVAADMLRMEPAPGRAGHHYTLTERGRDFFPVLMTALRWGDDWVYHHAKPHVFEHTGAGHVVDADLLCRACGIPLRARDVEVSRSGPVRSGGGLRVEGGRSRTPELALLERHGRSSIAQCLQVIGDRWSSLLLRSSFVGIRRFDQFQQDLGIAESILSQRLSRLIDEDVLTRRRYQEHPPRHEYVLTEKGLALYPVYLSILVWGDRWLQGDGPVLSLTHRPCGASVDPWLACAGCGNELDPSALTLVDR